MSSSDRFNDDNCPVIKAILNFIININNYNLYYRYKNTVSKSLDQFSKPQTRSQ